MAATRHRNFNIESRIPHEFSVDTLMHTWSPRFVPFWNPGEWPPYDGLKYIVDPAYHWNKHGSRKRTRHMMVMDQILERTRRGRGTHFLLTPSSTSTTSAVDWATIHALVIGRLVRCDYWLFLLFHICRIHSINYACLNLCL